MSRIGQAHVVEVENYTQFDEVLQVSPSTPQDQIEQSVEDVMPSKSRVNSNFIKDSAFVPWKTSADVPNNWPEDVVFLTEPTYSDTITSEMRAGLCRTTERNASFPKVTREVAEAPSKVEIRFVDAPGHPVHGHRGLFATEHLIPDALVCIYQGHVHTNAMSDTDAQSDYDLNLDGDLGLSVDAGKAGNYSRFANDFRGIAPLPNAEFRDCFIQVPCGKRLSGWKWERRVGIFVISGGNTEKRKVGILAGEEVLINYGRHYWEARQVIARFRNDHELLRIATAALEA